MLNSKYFSEKETVVSAEAKKMGIENIPNSQEKNYTQQAVWTALENF